jgi:siroheme synthase
VGANDEEDMRRAEKGNVYLVGSGPGNPELLTVRAVQLLETADVVFHDELVSDEVLELVDCRSEFVSIERCDAWG